MYDRCSDDVQRERVGRDISAINTIVSSHLSTRALIKQCEKFNNRISMYLDNTTHPSYPQSSLKHQSRGERGEGNSMVDKIVDIYGRNKSVNSSFSDSMNRLKISLYDNFTLMQDTAKSSNYDFRTRDLLGLNGLDKVSEKKGDKRTVVVNGKKIESKEGKKRRRGKRGKKYLKPILNGIQVDIDNENSIKKSKRLLNKVVKRITDTNMMKALIRIKSTISERMPQMQRRLSISSLKNSILNLRDLSDHTSVRHTEDFFTPTHNNTCDRYTNTYSCYLDDKDSSV